MKSLEAIYNEHHTKRRPRGFMVDGEKRGAFLRHHIGKGRIILDIGCRDGALTSTYCAGNTVTGLDIDSEALDYAKEKLGISIKQTDLNGDWDVEDGGYDVVVAAEVIEHLYYPERVIQRVKSALTPEGFLIGSVPHAFALQSRLRFLFGTKNNTPMIDPTHITHFHHKELQNLLEDSFEEVEVKGITSWKFRWISGLFPFLFAYDLLFYARKKKA